MHTATPDPFAPAAPHPRLTLLDWIDAHRAVFEEQERLNALAALYGRQQESPEALERQRMRVQVAQDAADAIYDAVMQDLRRSC